MSGNGGGSPSLSIRLTEAVVFLRGGVDLHSTKYRPVANAPPALLRGLLIFHVEKPVRVKSIEVELEGRTRSEWPEGIGARRIDIVEERLILQAKTVFFQATKPTRRNMSVGPGVVVDEDGQFEHRSSSDSTRTGAATSDDELEHTGSAYAPPARARSLDIYRQHSPHGRVSHVEPQIATPLLSDDEQDVEAAPPLVTTAATSPTSAEGSSDDLAMRRRDARRSASYFDDARPRIPSRGSSGQHLPLRVPTEEGASTSNGPNVPPPAYTPPIEEPRPQHRQSASASRSRRSPTPARSHSEIEPEVEAPRPSGSNRFSLSRMMTWRGGRPEGSEASPVTPAPSNVDSGARPGLSPIKDTESRGRTREKSSPWARLASTLRLDKDKAKAADDDAVAHGWQEFKKGTYTYPISFAIPANTPPTIHCQWGSVAYRLKAYVRRQGAFAPRLTASREVVLVAAPDDEELGDVTDTVGSAHGVGMHVHIERQWETQLRYLIVVGGRGAPIGGRLPIWMTLMPLAPIRIYRISLILEERVDYFAHRRQIVRHDPLRRWELLALKNEDKRLLPVDLEQHDSPLDALSASPVFPYICSDPYASADSNSGGKTTTRSEQRDDTLVNMLSPDGPWMLHAEVTIPQPCGRIHFTNLHPKSSLAVAHLLKIIIRTERGDDAEIDPKTGRKKQFDIVVQTPLHVLSCRCNNDWTSLPTYAATAPLENPGPLACNCVRKNATARPPQPPLASTSRVGTPNPAAAFVARPGSLAMTRAGAGAAHLVAYALQQAETNMSSPQIEGAGGPAPGDGLSEHSRKFERLMSGLESPAGDEPPQYM